MFEWNIKKMLTQSLTLNFALFYTNVSELLPVEYNNKTMVQNIIEKAALSSIKSG